MWAGSNVSARRIMATAAAGLALAGCGSGNTTSTGAGTSVASTTVPRSSASHPTSSDGVRAAALAWAHAFLTGTPLDIYNLQGPECLTGVKPTPANIPAAAAALQQERSGLEQHVGMSMAAVQAKITGASVRNVTDTTAEATVEYDLPASVTGNDNWVTYELIDGKWKVQDCRPPFGGSGDSASGSAP
jgi:hypothetical protein